MTVIRWNAFREIEPLAGVRFAPPVDIYEDQHKLVLKLEVPGVQQDDLDIQIEGRTLTVRGERKLASEEKQENFHRVEHRYGAFARTFTLPNTVDGESVKATYEAGVLQLELAKKAEAKPRQIKIGGASAAPKPIEGATAAA